jgi:RimJ/RimL family protein N-acetyltransferase
MRIGSGMIGAVPSLTEPVVTAGGMRRLEQPTLGADDLTIRPWRPADAPAVLEAYQDPGIQRWHVRSMTDVCEAAVWIGSWPHRWQAETGADWAVSDAGGRVVGRVGIKRLDLWDGIAEFAYWVVPAARGHNTAPRALTAVSLWAFEVLGLHRLELIHATDNRASCRAAGKAGFEPEGTMRRQGQHVDGWHDMHLHARLAD